MAASNMLLRCVQVLLAPLPYPQARVLQCNAFLEGSFF